MKMKRMNRRGAASLVFPVIFSLGMFFLDASPRIGLYFRGSYYAPSAVTFNDELRTLYNQSLQSTERLLQSYGLSTNLVWMEKIKGALSYGGGLEVFLPPRFSFVLDVEHWRRTRPASVEGSGSFLGSTVGFLLREKGEFSVWPLMATVRYYFPLDKVQFYLGTGVGYYLGIMKWTEISVVEIGGAVIDSEKTEQEGRGRAVLPHFDGGVDFPVTENLVISAEFRYIIGRIESFEISKSAETADVGKKITYINTKGEEINFPLELSGVHFGILLKILF
ncbi:MAG: hypothetical protein WCC06_05205 [Candidatus Aminicenantales bacterium]